MFVPVTIPATFMNALTSAVPIPPVKVIAGALVYPVPGFVTVTPVIIPVVVLMNAVAVAVVPAAGDAIVRVGATV